MRKKVSRLDFLNFWTFWFSNKHGCESSTKHNRFFSSMIKDKAGKVRKTNATNDKHVGCNGKQCLNCEVIFPDVRAFNNHLSLCNYQFDLQAPTILDSPYEELEKLNLYPRLDINFKMLLKGRPKRKKGKNQPHFARWLERNADFKEGICHDCTSMDCSGDQNSCLLITCLICNHEYCVLLLSDHFMVCKKLATTMWSPLSTRKEISKNEKKLIKSEELLRDFEALSITSSSSNEPNMKEWVAK